MNSVQERVVRAGQSALDFALELRAAPSRVTSAVERLRLAVEAAQRTGVSQGAARIGRGTPGQSVVRAKSNLLRQHLRPIAADALELFAGLPGLRESLRLARLKAPAARHLDAAKRVRRVAEEHAEELIEERDYPPDFLKRFDAAVANLEAAAGSARGSAQREYSRLTAELEKQISAIRQALDSLGARIAESYGDERAVLETWRRARRIPAKRGRPKKKREPSPKERPEAPAAPETPNTDG